MDQLHIVLFPVMAYGHIIPTLDMAKLFTTRGLRATMITTPHFAPVVERARASGHDVGIETLDFPPKNSTLPKNLVSLDQISNNQVLAEFFQAMVLLRDPLERLLRHLGATCLVSDSFLHWTADIADALGIPRIVFHGTSCFAQCASEKMHIHKPYQNVSSETEVFALPGLPHELTFIRTQVPAHPQEEGENANPFPAQREKIRESERQSFGVVINSFHELEPEYSDHYQNVMGRKAWHVGPLLLCNKDKDKEISQRGKEPAVDEHACLKWLDSKKPNSVVYVCFGSMVTFTRAQLHETAAGLESSGHHFVWAVRQGDEAGRTEDLLPEGFEERTKGRGLVIRGWAPQLTILNHGAVGAFVTHCGWNSTLEGVCAGVPMVTWPTFAEQFFNEKLLTEVLRVGVPVGSKRWEMVGNEGVGREAVRAAVQAAMAGEEMRRRARDLREAARRAVAEGGSSYETLNALIEEVRAYEPPKKGNID